MSNKSKKISQVDIIINHIETHGCITQLEAYNLYGIMRLASRMHDIRNKGYETECIHEIGVNRYGYKTRFAKYSIVKK